MIAQRQDRLVGIVGLRRKEGRALGTEPRGEGGVLLVGTDDDTTVLEAHRGPHMEVGIDGITVARGLDGLPHERLVLGGELVHLTERHLYLDFKVLHGDRCLMSRYCQRNNDTANLSVV